MEKIVNGLVLSPEQKAAFLAAAPGVEQIFLRDGEITATGQPLPCCCAAGRSYAALDAHPQRRSRPLYA